MAKIKQFLESEGILEYGIIDMNKLSTRNPRLLLEVTGFKSALIFLVPYRFKGLKARDGINAGHFARCRDYHLWFDGLFKRALPVLRKISGGAVRGYADHSPINESEAAQLCGLGFRGRNTLLINPRYGSFVFIGSFFFERHLEESIKNGARDSSCGSCFSCVDNCLAGALNRDGVDLSKCLAAVSQKKRKTEEEKALLKQTRTLWGCDRCQDACPRNSDVEESGIPYFKEGFIESFSPELVGGMSDEKFAEYAFSFRGRKVFAENFTNL